MCEEAIILPVSQWDDATLGRVGALLSTHVGSELVLVDDLLDTPLPGDVRKLVADGAARVVRCQHAADDDEPLRLAARIATGKDVLVARGDGALAPWEGPRETPRRPGASVLIPMYEAGSYAGEAVASVLAQSYAASELFVVDDGSSDDGAEHARKALCAGPSDLRAALVHMPHRGQAASRNTGLLLASCEWVFYLDADDVLLPDALEVLLAGAKDDPGAGMVCSRCRDFVSPDLSAEEAAKLKTNPEPYQRMLAGCTLIRHAVYDLVGPYDETLPSSETAQWMLRMKDRGITTHNIDDVTLMRRYHRNNFGRRDRKTQLASYMAIIKQRRAKRDGEE